MSFRWSVTESTQTLSLLLVLFAIVTSAFAQQARGTLIVEVRSGSRPVTQAEVLAGETDALTNERGEAVLELPAGAIVLTIQRFGYKTREAQGVVVSGSTTRLTVDLEAEVVIREEIIVTATRTGRRIEDEPLRVEVIEEEEIEEKALMTPGDIAMLLNETGGLRVQVTAPSLGAANVRVQGLRGRYTQLLADGLPLYGGQTGSIGLLQIPPLDLGQVEVIKGVASALYGSSALGGVINLVSRRSENAERQLLLNRTSRDGTDVGFWLAEPLAEGKSYTVLGGLHHQVRADIDNDGWSDLPGYRRAVLRPRFFWGNDEGSSVFATFGAMAENRAGGSTAFEEKLNTRRFDTGLAGRFVVGRQLLSVRGSAMTQGHRHQFGDVLEQDRHHTWFGEAVLSGTTQGHTWAIGSALQGDVYRARQLPRFNYTYTVPAVFVQDDYSLTPQFTLSGSGRFDFHSEYGSFFNPRVSALLRLPRQWVARVSTGTGVFAPTPFTEETEAVGLSRLLPPGDIKPERAWSASGDLGWSGSLVEINGTIFGSIIRHPVMLRQAGDGLDIVNAPGPTRTAGSEFLTRIRREPLGIVFTHTFVHSTEIDIHSGTRRRVPLTPRHTAGLVGMWEDETRGRVGLEVFYTGRQMLDDNPYRSHSDPYWIFGVLAERRFGIVRLFLNLENLGNVRQTRYDRLVRPQRNFEGRWTVDAWAPLEGRVINGGMRINF
jgi:iron complex outermembrane receptor protein